MMYEEFVKIAGYEVSMDDYYNIIEPMYMAIPPIVSKYEFVEMLDKKRFALKPMKNLISEAKKIAIELRDTCERYTDEDNEMKFDGIMSELRDRFSGEWIVNRKHYISEDRGCTFPSEIVRYDSEWREIERFMLCKAYWEFDKQNLSVYRLTEIELKGKVRIMKVKKIEITKENIEKIGDEQQ